MAGQDVTQETEKYAEWAALANTAHTAYFSFSCGTSWYGNSTGEIPLFSRADISDVMNLLEDTNVRANFKTYGTSEYYVMMSMIRLIDMITGSEREDYKPELVEKQKKMHTLLQDISKRLADDVRNVDPSMVKEIVAQVTARWTIMQRKFANDSAGFITGSIEGTRMKRKNAAKS